MKDFCVIGSGVAGSTIANLLAKNYSVEIFDKARGPGGRASNRRYNNNLSFDHGLQYISPRSSNFKKFIEELKRKKILKKWLGDHLDFTFKKNEKPIKYIGVNGNNDICKYLIKNIKSSYLSNVTSIKFASNYWTITLNYKTKIYFKNLIITCPFPQLKKLCSKYLSKNMLSFKAKMLPNITVIVAYQYNKEIPISSIRFNDNTIAWASCENTKDRFKSNKSLWTIQCTEEFSKKHINLYKINKKKYISNILKKFETLTGIQKNMIIKADIHGWKYAYSKGSNKVLSSSLIGKFNLGICADWFLGSKAEDAWDSAQNLFKRIKKNPLNIIKRV